MAANLHYNGMKYFDKTIFVNIPVCIHNNKDQLGMKYPHKNIDTSVFSVSCGGCILSNIKTAETQLLNFIQNTVALLNHPSLHISDIHYNK